jgi:septal ring factor EnvC (AmiA/AmiB activator)
VKRAVAAIVLVLAAPVAAQQSDRGRAESMAERADERLRVLHAEAARLADQARTLLGDLRKLEVQRQIRAEELRRLEADAAAAASELEAVDRVVRRLDEETRAARPDVEARLVELYKLGQGRYLRLMLSTSDVRQVGHASRTVAALAKRDRDRIAAHRQRLEELRESRAVLDERSRRLAQLRTEAARARSAADRAVEEHNALIREIDLRRDLNAQLAGELDAARQKLQTLIASPAAAPSAANAASLPLRPFRGELDWPVTGPLRRRFAGGTAAGGRGSAWSNGIEIAAGEGTPVHAVHDGSVAFAGPFAGFGTLVIVDHGAGNFSLYGQLLEAQVATGARVARGELVGSAGSAVTGTPGLYFELRVDGRPVDPLQWLKQR